MDIERLIRTVTDEVLHQLAGEGLLSGKPKVLVLYPGLFADFQDVDARMMRGLPDTRFDLVIGMDQTVKDYCDTVSHPLHAGCQMLLVGKDVWKLIPTVKDYSCILFTHMPFSIGQRLLERDDSHPYVAVALAAQMQGKPLVVVADGLAGPDAGQMLRGLAERGVSVTSASNLHSTLDMLLRPKPAPYETVKAKPVQAVPLDGELVTEADVIRFEKAGIRELLVGKGTIITPLARDRARHSGITFIGGS